MLTATTVAPVVAEPPMPPVMPASACPTPWATSSRRALCRVSVTRSQITDASSVLRLASIASASAPDNTGISGRSFSIANEKLDSLAVGAGSAPTTHASGMASDAMATSA